MNLVSEFMLWTLHYTMTNKALTSEKVKILSLCFYIGQVNAVPTQCQIDYLYCINSKPLFVDGIYDFLRCEYMHKFAHVCTHVCVGMWACGCVLCVWCNFEKATYEIQSVDLECSP